MDREIYDELERLKRSVEGLEAIIGGPNVKTDLEEVKAGMNALRARIEQVANATDARLKSILEVVQQARKSDS